MADVYADDGATAEAAPDRNDTLLFWASFIALIATAFGFVIRSQLIKTWMTEFHLDKTQIGQIQGAGFWPFAISIILFSLIIDRVGYGKSMVFAFVCHVAGAIMTIMATGYQGLYWATLVTALGNGTVEAVTNPVVATLFARDKTKWLNRLHAGWPGGLVLGGILALALGDIDWRIKIGLVFLPVLAYGVLMLGRRFPVNERVAAGVSYKPMLQEVGIVGAMIVVALIVRALGNAFGIPDMVQLIVGVFLIGAYGVYVRAIGQPLFIVLLLIMIPLATTELGTDAWIGDIMTPAMADLGKTLGVAELNGAWVLIYTSTIMLILRFFAGPIAHKLSPLGLLAISAAIAACGLVFLSKATGLSILAAATLYGLGKTFFWPTMLGVVSEQFPKGGALTLNATGGVGMLAVGVLGAPLLGNIQDTKLDKDLATNNPAIYQKVAGTPKRGILGEYTPIDYDKIETLPPEEKAIAKSTEVAAQKEALSTVAIFPCIMLASYLGLLLYFRSKGGYRPKELVHGKEVFPELAGHGV